MRSENKALLLLLLRLLLLLFYFFPSIANIFFFQLKGTVHSKLTYLLFTATTWPFCSCAEEKNFLWWEDAWHVTTSETRKQTKRKQSAVVTDEPNSLWELLSHRRGNRTEESFRRRQYTVLENCTFNLCHCCPSLSTRLPMWQNSDFPYCPLKVLQPKLLCFSFDHNTKIKAYRTVHMTSLTWNKVRQKSSYCIFLSRGLLIFLNNL